jgi:hypothetical protein
VRRTNISYVCIIGRIPGKTFLTYLSFSTMCILIQGQDTRGFRAFSDVMAKPSMNNMAWIKAKIEAHFQCAGAGGAIPGASPQAILSRSFAAVGVACDDGAENAEKADKADKAENAKRQTPNAKRQTPNAKHCLLD